MQTFAPPVINLDSSNESESGEMIVEDESSGEKILYEPPKFYFANDDERIQKEYDDDLISENTVNQRLQSLPTGIAKLTYIPKRQFMIKYVDTDSSYDIPKVKTFTLDPIDARIKKNNVLQYICQKMKDGLLLIMYSKTILSEYVILF